MSAKVPVCPYCGGHAGLVTGVDIYPHRPALASRQFWKCAPCGAYVGCHPGTLKPLGRLANAELRSWKVRAHAAFDPHWRDRGMTRQQAYQWLAAELGLTQSECHIGMFDVTLCQLVVEVVNSDRARRITPLSEAGV